MNNDARRLEYDESSKESIRRHAELLLESCLRDRYGKVAEEAVKELNVQLKDKGKLGLLIEFLHFGVRRNSRAEPDFPLAGVELKTTGIQQLKKEVVAKERLSLGLINYMLFEDPREWNFETSQFWKKNSLILLMVYLHEKELKIFDYVFKLVDYLDHSDADLEIIRGDWETIIEKIKAGKAHELSDGDTLYLGASTKGGKGGNPRPQPFNAKKAKQRAFTFKKGYLDHLLASLSGKSGKNYGRVLKTAKRLRTGNTFEEIVIGRFERFYGKTIEEIVSATTANELNRDAYQFYSKLTRAMLDVDFDKEIEEFDKADIQLKSVRLDKNGLPEEAVSFPKFEFIDLVEEKWELSSLKTILESKFLFVFYQYTSNDQLVLRRARFWNMPQADIKEAKKVWMEARRIVNEGKIQRGELVRKDGKKIRLTNFPGSDFNRVLHVRPHASKTIYTNSLPVQDKYSKEWEYTDHCFWLNKQYVRDEIYLPKLKT